MLFTSQRRTRYMNRKWRQEGEISKNKVNDTCRSHELPNDFFCFAFNFLRSHVYPSLFLFPSNFWRRPILSFFFFFSLSLLTFIRRAITARISAVSVVFHLARKALASRVHQHRLDGSLARAIDGGRVHSELRERLLTDTWGERTGGNVSERAAKHAERSRRWRCGVKGHTVLKTSHREQWLRGEQ